VALESGERCGSRVAVAQALGDGVSGEVRHAVSGRGLLRGGGVGSRQEADYAGSISSIGSLHLQ
jgi:hypothetical protein